MVAKAAAGTVVTAMNTPTSEVDLAVVSASMPAAPANRATMNENGPTLVDEVDLVQAVQRRGGQQAGDLEQHSGQRGDRHGRRETERQGQPAPSDHVQPAQHQPDRHGGQWPELRPQHHRADHGDRRVGDRADRGQRQAMARKAWKLIDSRDSSPVRPPARPRSRRWWDRRVRPPPRRPRRRTAPCRLLPGSPRRPGRRPARAARPTARRPPPGSRRPPARHRPAAGRFPAGP